MHARAKHGYRKEQITDILWIKAMQIHANMSKKPPSIPLPKIQTYKERNKKEENEGKKKRTAPKQQVIHR